MPGTLIAIGGAEDKTRDREILRRFVAASGGERARIAVLATASELPGTGERYAELFHGIGCLSVEVLQVMSRQQAGEAGTALLEPLARATGIFLSGGSQLRLTSALGGTSLAAAVVRRHAEGMVVAGTSAGAAVLSEHMIAFGDSGGTPRRRLVQFAPGLGLVRGLVIDQHFRQRDRLGRLLAALSLNPGPLGVGIDEDTAAVIEFCPGRDPRPARLTVIGKGAVTVADASGLLYTNGDRVGSQQPIALLGLRLDVLVAGCGYDLHSRRALPPGGDGWSIAPTNAGSTVEVRQ